MKFVKILLFIASCLTVASAEAADGTRNTAFAGTGASGDGPIEEGGFWYRGGANAAAAGGTDAVMQGKKIITVGFLNYPTFVIILSRFNPDGTADTTFGTSGTVTITNTFLSISSLGSSEPCGLAITSDNSILIACALAVNGSTQRFAVIKLDPDGALDTNFQPSTTQGVYGGNVRGVWYITGAGGSEPFTGAGRAYTVKLQRDGKILLGGSITYADSSRNMLIARLNANGTLDTTGFNALGAKAGFWYKSDASDAAQTAYFNGTTWILWSRSIAIQSDNKIVIGVYFTGSQPWAGVMRLTSAGVLDTSTEGGNTPFNQSGSGTFGGNIPGYYVLQAGSGDFSRGVTWGVCVDNSDRIYASMYIVYSGASTYFGIMRLTPNGNLDTDFNAGGSGSAYGGTTSGFWIITPSAAIQTSNGSCIASTIDPTGRLIATGTVNNGTEKQIVVRLTSAGKLDTTFNPSGVAGNPYGGTIAGIYYVPSSATSAPFNINAVATSVTVDSVGQILVAAYNQSGAATYYFVVSSIITKLGILQDTESPFNTSSSLSGMILTTTIDQSGKLLAGGFYGSNAQLTRYNVASSTVRDSGFSGDGVATGDLTTTATINKVINSGTGYLVAGVSNTSQFTTALYTSAGALGSYGTGGIARETTVGVSQAYDMLLNGTALAVAGVTSTNVPSVINYNASTGARSTNIGSNGLQTFSNIGTGTMYGINTTTGTSRYGAGQAGSIAFLRLLNNTAGILQDTAAPFDTGANALLYTTTITQAGNLVVGGQYNNLWKVISYTPTAARNSSFNTTGVAADTTYTSGRVRALALDSTGRIIATGTTLDVTVNRFTTSRYNATGTSSTSVRETAIGESSGFGVEVNDDDSFLVPGFSTTGVADVTPTIVTYTSAFTEPTGDIAQYSDASMVPGNFYAVKDTGSGSFAAGSADDTAVVFSLIDGTGLLQDTAAPFNEVPAKNGIMYGGMYDNADRIVLCGSYNNIFTVVRYSSVGERDPFTVGVNGVLQEPTLGVASGYAITQDSAGSYYVAAQSTVGGTLTFTVVKYLSTGVLDTTFGNNGIIQETTLGVGKATAIKIDSDGTVLVGGQTTVNGVLLPTLIAYDTDGDRLEAFGTNGVQTFSQFGTGTLNGLTIINISTTAAVGQMGNVATVVEVGQSSNVFKQILSGL